MRRIRFNIKRIYFIRNLFVYNNILSIYITIVYDNVDFCVNSILFNENFRRFVTNEIQ